MKDWKAEYDKLRGQYVELQKQAEYLRRRHEEREERATELKDSFKRLIIEVLEK